MSGLINSRLEERGGSRSLTCRVASISGDDYPKSRKKITSLPNESSRDKFINNICKAIRATHLVITSKRANNNIPPLETYTLKARSLLLDQTILEIYKIIKKVSTHVMNRFDPIRSETSPIELTIYRRLVLGPKASLRRFIMRKCNKFSSAFQLSQFKRFMPKQLPKEILSFEEAEYGNSLKTSMKSSSDIKAYLEMKSKIFFKNYKVPEKLLLGVSTKAVLEGDSNYLYTIGNVHRPHNIQSTLDYINHVDLISQELVYSCLNNNTTARYIQVEEPLKVRSLTAMPAHHQILKGFQESLKDYLDKDPTFQLTNCPDIQKAINSMNWPSDLLFTSGDYSAATDTIFRDSILATLRGINFHLPELKEKYTSLGSKIRSIRASIDKVRSTIQSLEYHQSFDFYEANFNLTSLPKHRFNERRLLTIHSHYMQAYRFALDKYLRAQESKSLVFSSFDNLTIVKKERDGTNSFVLNQRNGQLMGSLLSFIFLCLINKFIYEFTQEQSDQRSTAPLINGDDILFKSTEKFHHEWRKNIGLVGFRPSPGKNFLSPTHFTINSRPFSVDPTYHLAHVNSEGCAKPSTNHSSYTSLQFINGKEFHHYLDLYEYIQALKNNRFFQKSDKQTLYFARSLGLKLEINDRTKYQTKYIHKDSHQALGGLNYNIGDKFTQFKKDFQRQYVTEEFKKENEPQSLLTYYLKKSGYPTVFDITKSKKFLKNIRTPDLRNKNLSIIEKIINKSGHVSYRDRINWLKNKVSLNQQISEICSHDFVKIS